MDKKINTAIPRISVVMPLYNKEKYVQSAINSVLNQKFGDFELIIVNDGSTDKGPEIVKNFNDDRIIIIDQENFGVSVARNKGIAASKADLIAYLDADDVWADDYLSTIMLLKKNYPDCKIFGTGYFYLNPDGSKKKPCINGIPRSPWQGIICNYFHVASISDPPLWSSAIATNRDAIISVGLFPENITSGEDLLTWARLAVKYSIAYDSTCCAFFRQPETTNGLPTRIPDTPDIVGKELKTLLVNAPKMQRPSLKRYIAWWHKNRASMYLRLGYRIKAFKEVLKMGRYHINKKLFLYLATILLPMPLIIKAFKYYKTK